MAVASVVPVPEAIWSSSEGLATAAARPPLLTPGHRYRTGTARLWCSDHRWQGYRQKHLLIHRQRAAGRQDARRSDACACRVGGWYCRLQTPDDSLAET